MKRFIGVLLVTVLFLGSVALCQRMMTKNIKFNLSREVSGHGEEVHEKQSEHTYLLKITSGFEAMASPFSLNLDDDAESVRILVRRNEEVLLKHTEDVTRGESITVENLSFPGNTVSLYLEGTPGEIDRNRPCAMRIQLLRQKENVLCDEATLWSNNAGNVSGSVNFNTSPRLESLDRGLGSKEKN